MLLRIACISRLGFRVLAVYNFKTQVSLPTQTGQAWLRRDVAQRKPVSDRWVKTSSILPALETPT